MEWYCRFRNFGCLSFSNTWCIIDVIETAPELISNYFLILIYSWRAPHSCCYFHSSHVFSPYHSQYYSSWNDSSEICCIYFRWVSPGWLRTPLLCCKLVDPVAHASILHVLWTKLCGWISFCFHKTTQLSIKTIYGAEPYKWVTFDGHIPAE